MRFSGGGGTQKVGSIVISGGVLICCACGVASDRLEFDAEGTLIHGRCAACMAERRPRRVDFEPGTFEALSRLPQPPDDDA